ncbi:hypothetical protein TNCV_4640741 [Trichonephila clavipes]|nr:hypothetical protein TNCV_4640741 [Trichonephila clavipes]
MVRLKKPACLQIFHFFSSCYREYRPLLPRMRGSCTMMHQNILRLQCLTTSLLHIPGGVLDETDQLLGLHTSLTSNSDLFFWDYLKTLVCETSVATVEDFMARNVFAQADITSTPGWFEGVRQPFTHQCWLCNDLRGCNFE